MALDEHGKLPKQALKAQCILVNCRNLAPAGEAFCADHRDQAAKRKEPRP